MFCENPVRALVVPIISLALSGCGFSTSTEMPYASPPVVAATRTPGKQVTVGVAQFHDKRPWVDTSDPHSEGIIGDALTPSGESLGPRYRQGMTYHGRDYFPVKDFIQLVLIDQLRSSGFDARLIDRIVSRDDDRELEAAGQQAGVEYVVAGDVLKFQWELAFSINPDLNTAMELRRYLVILPVTLVRTAGARRLIDRPFLKAAEFPLDEIMTNHYRAYNQVLLEQFNKVVAQIVQEIAAKTVSLEAPSPSASR